MESQLPLIIQLISSAVGGNVAGSVMKNLSVGTVGNSIAGIAGGGIGGQLLSVPESPTAREARISAASPEVLPAAAWAVAPSWRLLES